MTDAQRQGRPTAPGYYLDDHGGLWQIEGPFEGAARSRVNAFRLPSRVWMPAAWLPQFAPFTRLEAISDEDAELLVDALDTAADISARAGLDEQAERYRIRARRFDRSTT